MQCPHCLKHFHDDWIYEALPRRTGQNIWGAAITHCPACREYTIKLGRVSAQFSGPSGTLQVEPGREPFTMVYPKGRARAPIPPEVPKEFTADYSEASLVLSDSEKASAALSRRCLQHLLREHLKVKRGDLSNEIQEVIDSKQLPGYLAQDLDAIRNIGNFAAHPLKSTSTGEIVDVEPTEAEWLLTLLEGLFDFCFVQPARAKANRDALNQKLGSLGKPPMKVVP